MCVAMRGRVPCCDACVTWQSPENPGGGVVSAAVEVRFVQCPKVGPRRVRRYAEQQSSRARRSMHGCMDSRRTPQARALRLLLTAFRNSAWA